MSEQKASVCKSIYVLAFTWLWPKEWYCQYKQNKVTPLCKVSRSSKEERLGRSLSASLWRLFRHITLETDLGVDPGEEITVHVSSNLCVSWETLERGDIWNTLCTVILYFLQLRSLFYSKHVDISTYYFIRDLRYVLHCLPDLDYPWNISFWICAINKMVQYSAFALLDWLGMIIPPFTQR